MSSKAGGQPQGASLQHGPKGTTTDPNLLCKRGCLREVFFLSQKSENYLKIIKITIYFLGKKYMVIYIYIKRTENCFL